MRSVTDPTTTETPEQPVEQPTEQPALTRGVIAGIISGALILLATRANRSWDILDAAELDNFKILVGLAAPALAGWLISRHVVPAGKADRAANFFMSAGYAQGLQDKQDEVDFLAGGTTVAGAGLKDQGGSLGVGSAQPPTPATVTQAQTFADQAVLVDEGFLAFIVPVKAD